MENAACVEMYVHPGKYTNGFITKRYTEEQGIEVSVQIASNHRRFFCFSVGKLEKSPITQEQMNHVLLQTNSSNTWPLHSSTNRIFKIKLKLPKVLACAHCVMLWWWTVGNNCELEVQFPPRRSPPQSQRVQKILLIML